VALQNGKPIAAEARRYEVLALKMGGESNTQIAERVGYGEVRAFLRAFKRRYRVTPTEYRKACERARRMRRRPHVDLIMSRVHSCSRMVQ